MLNSMTNNKHTHTHRGREKESERGFPVCLKSTKDLCQTERKRGEEGRKSARRIYKSSKSDLMPYSRGKKKKRRDENDARHKVSQSVCMSVEKGCRTRESLCELTCLCRGSHRLHMYMSVYLYIHSIYGEKSN